ncbi:molybdopterin-dependent oxidoreductase [Ilumatobacter sp.]|uniref:molybdopterin-dependent oxidoreductase n=1 Tax=Ilumatobacter sp. TaxID=1967498 RepID=UPI003C6F524A
MSNVESAAAEWHQTACILCSINCGIEVKLDGPTITRVRGDKAHPASEGYTCEKALRLDHYQNGAHRLTSPMRRRPDGSFEEVDWDTAIAEVAARYQDVIDEHGGEKIFFYGGGGQGNHLGGGYGAATRAALGITYQSNALAQEKTGEFWVDGQLFGRSSCHTTGDYHHAEVSVFWGKNPWQSHGFPQARKVLKAIANDPTRTMIVVDPRRTETADLADIHLRPVPGGDAHLLAALVKVIAEEHAATSWLAENTNGFDELRAHLAAVDVTESCAKAGTPEEQVREAAAVIGRATNGVSIFEDLGIQMAPHSTLNSYLEKLVVLLTGNFGVRGGMNLHTRFASLGGGGGPRKAGGGVPSTPVTGHRLVTGLVPCNVIPEEIIGDHPDRFRAMLVESGNPVHSLADSQAMRTALRQLDFLCVIDVAMTETAREADYVLPAASQFEKWECTFFNLEFPSNYFHLRRPVFEPLDGTLPECEIHSRLCRALGAYDDEVLTPLTEAAAAGRSEYTAALVQFMVDHPDLGKLLPVVLYETLGPTLRTEDGVDASGAAAIWGLSQQAAGFWHASIRRAGIDPQGTQPLGEALFEQVLANPSGLIFSTDDYDETMKRLLTPDGRINLVIPSLLDEFDALAGEPSPVAADEAFPFVLAAGERRSSSANTIYRDPSWRKLDKQGALRLSPADAQRLELTDGDRARVVTKRGGAVAFVEITDTMRDGHVSLPNGFGLDAWPGTSSDSVGIAPNELTSSEDRDWFAGTPFHKHVRARIERVEQVAD